MDKRKLQNITLLSMLVACAFVLSFVESQLPVFIAVPGIKLGLTNVVVLLAFYKIGNKEAFCVNVVRILFAGLTFSGLFSMLYSLAGGVLSYTGMLLLKKSGKFSVQAVSIAGGVLHNVGQIAVAAFVLESRYVFYYLPFLWISGIVSGAAIGILGSVLVKKLPKSITEKSKDGN